jgi:archaellum component FlaC
MVLENNIDTLATNFITQSKHRGFIDNDIEHLEELILTIMNNINHTNTHSIRQVIIRALDMLYTQYTNIVNLSE